MDYLYLGITVLCSASAGVFGAYYNQKTAERKDPSPLYNLLYCLTALLGWAVLFATDPSFVPGVLPYSLGFGLSYVICQIGLINALRTGPVSLTSLFLQLSLIATTVWGFFFWDESFSVTIGIGLVLVGVSLWLCLYKGKTPKKEAVRATLKWFLFVLMAVAGNAGCAIIQKTQQRQFEGKYGNQLMVVAIAISVLFSLVLYLRSNHSDTKLILKRATLFPVGAGLCNVVLNLLVILLATSTVPSSLVYPVIAVGGLAVTSIFSFLAFREKLRYWQWIGIGIGAVSVVLLSL